MSSNDEPSVMEILGICVSTFIVIGLSCLLVAAIKSQVWLYDDWSCTKMHYPAASKQEVFAPYCIQYNKKEETK